MVRGFAITRKHIETLARISKGMIQEDIAREFHEAPPSTSYRIKILIREGYLVETIKDAIRVLSLTPKALTILSHTGNTKVSQSSNLPQSSNPAPKPRKSALPDKRLNGMQLYFAPFRTEYSRLETLLQEAHIPYKKNKVRNYTQYTLIWEGYSLKFTTRKLIAYCPYAFKGFEVQGKVFINEKIGKALVAVRNLVAATGIRLLERNGAVWFRLKYFELAHTQSGTAEAVTRKKSYQPLCYELKTGDIIAWGDNSLKLHELEFSRLEIEKKVADMLQAMEQDKWLPLNEQAQRLADRELLHETVTVLNEYGKKLNAHIPVLELAEKLLHESPKPRAKKAIEKLGQHRLFEDEGALQESV